VFGWICAAVSVIACLATLYGLALTIRDNRRGY
jgi:hypothetical protein